jgi:CDP-glucose 4,6-dehydratase
MNPSFWLGKRVLVTGHTGFKGSWLCLWLRELGCDVFGLSLPVQPDARLHYKEARVSSFVEEFFVDVRDVVSVHGAFTKAQPEVVFHLAAQPLVGASYDDPVGTFEVNVLGTVNVLEAARRCSHLQSIVVITTDKCYENVGWTWGYRENDALGGADPYSASKAAAEVVVTAYRKSFFADGPTKSSDAKIGSARAGNVIGGGDYTVGRLVPDVVRSISERQVCLLRNPFATRPWQHVLEPLAGYLRLAELLPTHKSISGAWNFGPDMNGVASAKAIAEALIAQWGSQIKLEINPGAFHEAAILALDSTKAKSVLGWFPQLSISEAIAWTVEWAQRQLKGELAAEISLDQIRRYQARTTTASTLNEFANEK